MFKYHGILGQDNDTISIQYSPSHLWHEGQLLVGDVKPESKMHKI